MLLELLDTPEEVFGGLRQLGVTDLLRHGQSLSEALSDEAGSVAQAK
jgi:hypothetical protein